MDQTAITVVYNPPQTNYQHLKNVLKNNIFKTSKPHIIIGDMNINLDKCEITKHYTRSVTQSAYKIINKIHKKHHTIVNVNGNHSILDHVVTSIPKQIKSFRLTQLHWYYHKYSDFQGQATPAT